ncbi:aldose 1-epimerase [Asticcacaulis sp. AC460]|uniref:aldose 1-epimerase n=1 Tax=Asticcacaulis sp. AC460 TaxID=1282360 RepID=UPI0003C3DD68|nr:aldose 1-epimerase [Asticcacaulis sp. AC460]ESQ87095.1 aldose 1-epimerase [Asticcacaulis sp. AC460]
MLRLSSNETTLDICPEVAGSIWRFVHQGRDIMRPTADGTTDALMTASFPLVPYCNRIRNGEFAFEGKKVRLSPNLGNGHPHPLHGQGWRQVWQVIETSATRAVLSYVHDADEWPWAYEAVLVYELRPAGLRAYLSVKNLSRNTMPAGLGFHPYFNRTRQTRLKAVTTGIWRADDDCLPVSWHAGVLRKDWSQGDLVDHEVAIDHCYTGFGGRAEIFEGERSVLTLRASPDCKWMHVFAPLDHLDFFCVEPVNHMPDPFNQPNSGLKCLKAGETSMVWMDIAVN